MHTLETLFDQNLYTSHNDHPRPTFPPPPIYKLRHASSPSRQPPTGLKHCCRSVLPLLLFGGLRFSVCNLPAYFQNASPQNPVCALRNIFHAHFQATSTTLRPLGECARRRPRRPSRARSLPSLLFLHPRLHRNNCSGPRPS